MKLRLVFGTLFLLCTSAAQSALPVSTQVCSLIVTPVGNATYSQDKTEGCNWVFADGSKLEAMIYYGANTNEVVEADKRLMDMIINEIKRTMELVPDNHSVFIERKKLTGCNQGERLVVDAFNGSGPEGFAYLACPTTATVLHFSYIGKTALRQFETIYLPMTSIVPHKK